MKEKILLLMCLVLFTGSSVFAQKKTVTNSDLEKFRSKRLSAEKDLRENYAKLGFPSPEELQKQIEKDGAEIEELAAKLRAERLEREKTEAENKRREVAVMYVPLSVGFDNYLPRPAGFYGGGIISYGFPGFRHPRRSRNHGFFGPSWRADASGVIYEPGSRPASIWTPRVVTPRIRERRR